MTTLFSISPWLTGHFYIFFHVASITGFLLAPFGFFYFDWSIIHILWNPPIWSVRFNGFSHMKTCATITIDSNLKYFYTLSPRNPNLPVFPLAAFAFDVTFKKSLPKPMSNNLPLCFPLRDLQVYFLLFTFDPFWVMFCICCELWEVCLVCRGMSLCF